MDFDNGVVDKLNLDADGLDNWNACCGRVCENKFSTLLVNGTVAAPNPGAIPRLEKAIPQGINPAILMLNLVYDQLPGLWPQVITYKPVGYCTSVQHCDIYTQVHVTGPGITVNIKPF